MSSEVGEETLFGRKRSLASSPWAGHCYLKNPAGQAGRLLAFVWASGGSAGRPSPDPDVRALNQPRLHPSSNAV